MNTKRLMESAKQVLSDWKNRRGVSVHLSDAELTGVMTDVDQHWSEAGRDNFLKRLSQSYEPFRQVTSESKKGKSKGKKAPIEVES